jgi:hypothetical protein
MRAHVTLAMLATAAALAGCGSNHSLRPAVSRYLSAVNAVEAQLSGPLNVVTEVGSSFARTEDRAGGTAAIAAQEQTLLGALHRVEKARGRLTAIPAPAPAARLRHLLLELTGGEVQMTRELAKLVLFLPQFTRLLGILPATTARLRAALAVNQPLGYGASGVDAELAVKARALRSYQATLGAVVAALRRLRPPSVSRPQYETQITTLDRMGSDAGRLAAALAVGGGANLPALVAAFTNAASGAQASPALRAQAAAVRRYDASLRRLTTLARAVERERTRLQATVR